MAGKPSYDDLRKRIVALENESRERIRIENELQYRLAFEGLITSISSTFISLPPAEIDAAVTGALRQLGEFSQVDRSYLFLYNSDGLSMDNTHEWCAPGIEPQIQRLKAVPLDLVPWFTRQINAAQVVHIPHISELPEEAALLREENLRQGIQSLIMVPTKFGGTVIGFLGLDSTRRQKTWPPDAISLLRIVGEILANALDRKRSEEALLRSEEKYRTILETIEESYWEVNLEGDFTFFSPSLCRLLKFTPDELMGMNYRDYVSPAVAKRVYQMFNKIFITGRSVRLSDFEHLAKDGTRILSEMSVALRRDPQGNPIGFKGISRDVTERKTAEQALLESEQRYRTVLEANPDPIVVYDMQACVIYFNPAFSEVFGWDLKACTGKRIDGFVPEDRRAESRQMAAQIVAGRSFSGIETQRLTKSGVLVPVSISGAVYKDAAGQPVGSIITMRDIREKKKMEQQLLNMQRMESIGTLAGGIAHDFNNLLMAIQGNVSLALYDMEERDPHRRVFEDIQKAVKSGSRLTSQLLGFARKGRYEVKLLELNRVVKDVSETYGRTRKDISIRFELAADLWAVEADEGQIEQVLLNILVNAGQAMMGGGELFIKTRNASHAEMTGRVYQPKPGKYAFLSIADTGVGIDKKVIDHIFEPFFTTKEMGRGTGLGLASAYGIIKGHGGYIDVESQLGRGTTFDIYLPASERGVPKVAEPAPKAVAGKETILLVDDEEMVLEIGQKILERLGYVVIKAQNGMQALEIYKQRHDSIDMIILDVIMPVIGGGEAFDRIKQIEPKVKILLSSGYSLDGQVAAILQRGCAGFIQKPFSIETLSAKIREILK
ncbi:MAG: PAS domain S-box protein [Desulfatitalea sp.]|nr:PAS domain S-box protein [Desulfatitalea sp.]